MSTAAAETRMTVDKILVHIFETIFFVVFDGRNISRFILAVTFTSNISDVRVVINACINVN